MCGGDFTCIVFDLRKSLPSVNAHWEQIPFLNFSNSVETPVPIILKHYLTPIVLHILINKRKREEKITLQEKKK